MGETVALHYIPLFSNLDPAEIAALRSLMRHRTFAPGEFILHEGDAGDCLYILLEGDAQVLTQDNTGREVILAAVGPGSFFGEMALLTSEPRSASVRAVGEVTTLALDHAPFLEFLQRNPHACFTVLTVLSQRLGDTAQLLRTNLRNVNDIEQERYTLGDRVSDKFASVMGSWSFILVQSVLLVLYTIWNVTASAGRFDPYPFLLMSLLLSFEAAYAAPIIMMSQNRQTAKDRLSAGEIDIISGEEISQRKRFKNV